MAKKGGIDFRDISDGLKKFRDFMLGRKHTLHIRYGPLIAPRSIPPAHIPRSPEEKYSNNYYHARNAMHSVMPPVVAHFDGTKPLSSQSCSAPMSSCVPMPGPPWAWDGHNYYCCETTAPPPKSPPCPPKKAEECPPPCPKQ